MCNTASTNFLIAEYTGLREEIVKRIEIQHQLISFAVVASGGFLSFIDKLPAKIFLAYSVLSLFLSLAWLQSDIRIKQIGKYINDHIEEALLGGGFGWEHDYQSKCPPHKNMTLSRFISVGIFVGTQVLAVILFFVKRKSVSGFSLSENVLLSWSCLIIIATVVWLFCAHHWLEKSG